MEFVKAWVSERSGNRYEIYRNDHGVLMCTCPACTHEQQCWEMKKLVGDAQVNEVIRVMRAARRVAKVKYWWDEFPELVLVESQPYVYEAWRQHHQVSMRRKW